MNQRELNQMSDADLLGLWSARREGRYEDPRPEGLTVASYGPGDPVFGMDDEAHIFAWVDSVPEVRKYRRALVLLLEGGLMPHQAFERKTMIRQAFKVTSRTWRRWAKEWNVASDNPLAMGQAVLRDTIAGIGKHRKWFPPEIPERHGLPCTEDEIRESTAEVEQLAEAKFPVKFAQKSGGYLVTSREVRDGKVICVFDRNNQQGGGHAA